MRKPLAFTLALFVASLFTAAVSLGQQGDRPQISNGPQIRALVYHETTGFRHASIPYAIEQLRAYGDANGIDVTADQTSAQFTDAGLAKYDVVVWLSTVGGVRGDPPLLTASEWAAFERYMERGGGYAGIHAGSDCCDESAWYGELLGNQARFHSHPGGIGGSPGCIGDRPGDPNVVGHTGSCFQAVVETEDDGAGQVQPVRGRHLAGREDRHESAPDDRSDSDAGVDAHRDHAVRPRQVILGLDEVRDRGA